MKIEQAKNKLWNEIKNKEGVEGVGITIVNRENVIKILVSNDEVEIPTSYGRYKVIKQNTGKFYLQ